MKADTLLKEFKTVEYSWLTKKAPPCVVELLHQPLKIAFRALSTASSVDFAAPAFTTSDSKWVCSSFSVMVMATFALLL